MPKLLCRLRDATFGWSQEALVPPIDFKVPVIICLKMFCSALTLTTRSPTKVGSLATLALQNTCNITVVMIVLASPVTQCNIPPSLNKHYTTVTQIIKTNICTETVVSHLCDFSRKINNWILGVFAYFFNWKKKHQKWINHGTPRLFALFDSQRKITCHFKVFGCSWANKKIVSYSTVTETSILLSPYRTTT